MGTHPALGYCARRTNAPQNLMNGAHYHVPDSSVVNGPAAWFDSDLVDFGRRPLIIDGAIGNRKGGGDERIDRAVQNTDGCH